MILSQIAAKVEHKIHPVQAATDQASLFNACHCLCEAASTAYLDSSSLLNLALDDDIEQITGLLTQAADAMRSGIKRHGAHDDNNLIAAFADNCDARASDLTQRYQRVVVSMRIKEAAMDLAEVDSV